MIRRPAAAGSFYPADAGRLAATVDRLLTDARARTPPSARPPMAIVVPHAGYPYSGPIAASAYATLAERERARVVLLGPAHFVPLSGIATSSAQMWRTPLGDVGVDVDLRAEAGSAGVAIDDEAHLAEHALEVQLPFLIRTLGADVCILPLAVGVTPPDAVGDVLDALAPSVDLVVVSTDLSHYLDDATARRIDRATAGAVVARDIGSIRDIGACGVHALRGIVSFARRHERGVRLLDLRTSADTVGGRERVVGYGAFAM